LTSVFDMKARLVEWLQDACTHRLEGMIHESAINDGPVVVEPGASIGPGACIEGPAYVGLLRSLGVEASYL